MRKWWVIGLLVSIAWTGVVIGAGMIHTDVILKGKITPAEDEALSGRYGMVCGVGLVATWIVAYRVHRRSSQPGNEKAENSKK